MVVDSLYREDQFYFGITYNINTSVPSGVSALGISGGLQLGYLRDMPINKQRNIAIGIGAGISIDQYGQNLLIEKGTTGMFMSEYEDVEESPFTNYIIYITDYDLTLDEFDNPYLVTANSYAVAPVSAYNSLAEFVLCRKPFSE